MSLTYEHTLIYILVHLRRYHSETVTKRAEIRHVLSKKLGEHYYKRYGHGNGCSLSLSHTQTIYGLIRLRLGIWGQSILVSIINYD